MSDQTEIPDNQRKRFTVYIDCEGPQFQNRLFAESVMKILGTIRGNVATGRTNGAIIDDQGKTIGNWHTQWRNDDPADRRPPR